jgi:hypothetical protein
MLRQRPRWWPRFSSTLRSTAVTARIGTALCVAITLLFVTGLLSHYQYEPWTWLPPPAKPVWGYRLTQGIHVATGMATIPLLLVNLWSVYPNLFRFPPIRSMRHALERVSVAVLVSAALVQVATGFMNVLNWYPFPWYFLTVHRFLGDVLVGSVLLHVGVKLPDIAYGLKAKLTEADVLTEIPWNENPYSHSNAGTLTAPPTPSISRRGLLAAAGAGSGIVVVTSVGQSVTPLEPLGLLAPLPSPSHCASSAPAARLDVPSPSLRSSRARSGWLCLPTVCSRVWQPAAWHSSAVVLPEAVCSPACWAVCCSAPRCSCRTAWCSSASWC